MNSKRPGLVEGADVAIEHRVVQVAALVDLHVGAHDLLVDVGRADELDRDRAHLVAGAGRPPRPGRSRCLRPHRHDARDERKDHKTSRRRTLRIRGLLGIVFKAGDVSEESEPQFSYRSVSLLGND